ncbi:MAG: sulfur carrier protein ThiS adenylyltransferase ThiF [Chitinispirillaceae bacterium]|jgi:sulfur carrier protein ThiS adenylyltransferase
MKSKELFRKNVPGTTKILRKACIGIAGCGGLGSNAAVALVRAGIGKLILADFDVVEESNLNRQYFFQSDIGEKKTEALAHHLKAINPHIQLILINKKITPADVPKIFKDADILIEAFDRAESKSWLLEAWSMAFPGRHIVCASGLSGIGRTEALKVRHSGALHIVGDGESQTSMGLCSARVAIAANMEANIAIELLVKNRKADDRISEAG